MGDVKVLEPSLVKDLSNHIYEKRKATAYQIESLTKAALANNDSQTIYRIINELTELTNGGTNLAKMGAITALGSVSVALGSFAIAYFLEEIIKPIFATFRAVSYTHLDVYKRQGLLHFLSEVVSIDHECLVCGFEGKNLESIRQHIYAKGHCKIPYESKEEKQAMAEFYDFYTEEEKPKRASTSKSVAFKEVDDQILVDVHEDEQREEDDDENVDDDDRMAIDNGINDNYSLVHVDRSGVELTLPTGSRIGHRSMARYYRQNIALPTEPSESSKTVALVDRRFASGLSAYQVSKEEKEIRKIELQVRNNYERKTKNRRVNFQKHFRDELLGPM